MPITQDFLDRTAGTSFSSSADVDAYFNQAYGAGFVPWFTANVAGRNAWGATPDRAAVGFATDAGVQDRFDRLWAAASVAAFFGGPMAVLQFLSLQSIVLNETGGSLTPLTEGVGRPGHPGIAYAFDAIPKLKASYNTLGGNQTCLRLFSDAGYNAAFGGRPLGDQLQNTTDAAWGGTAYPAGVPTSTDPAVTGYVLEADFYKFRGRGLIQTTGRSNYKRLIAFVLAFDGDYGAVANAKANWSAMTDGGDADAVATASANADWDELFQRSDYLIPATAVAFHNKDSGDYLGGVDGSAPDVAARTVRNVGLRVSGGSAYADLFLARVTQVIEAM